MDATLPDDVMSRLYDEAVSLGYVHGADFAVWGVPAALSSELVELGKRDGEYLLWHRDVGERHEVLRSSSAADVRREFLLELGRTAGPRGRGPDAGAPAPQRGQELTREQLIAQILSRPRDVDV